MLFGTNVDTAASSQRARRAFSSLCRFSRICLDSSCHEAGKVSSDVQLLQVMNAVRSELSIVALIA